MSNTFTTFIDKDGEQFDVQDAHIGSLADLDTTNKDSVVGAINEVAAKTPEGVITAAEIDALYE